ncbi:MAG: hypothetical protein H7099_07430 [Gemmatimonadaceae bacterium]|nr:hypothetical protein [Gemmatimonadaceae bacterium]
MTADPVVLDRIFDRLVRTLSAGGPDQFRAPFTVAEIVQSLVPYRTYRNELGVDTLQDYEHAVLEMLAGERGWLVCDPDTVAVIKKELSSPDPDTGLLRRLQTVEVRMGAIRMPVAGEPRAPIAREGDDVPHVEHAAVKDTPSVERTVVSDAVAIGAVMDREDAERAVNATNATAGVESTAAKPQGSKKSRRTPRANSVIAPASEPVPAMIDAAALPSVADLTTLVPPSEPVTTTPLHSVQGVTIASAQTLARITPLSLPSVYGDPIDFRGVRHAPVDIGGVIFLFGMVARELGFHVEAMASGFPRCEAKRQIAPGKWARLRIDFEHESRQFRDAGRNPVACDLIVCWRDTWPDRPASLDVLALDRVLSTLARD